MHKYRFLSRMKKRLRHSHNERDTYFRKQQALRPNWIYLRVAIQYEST